MGLVKHQMIEDDERGWSSIDDKFVCPDCVEDEFLKQQITAAACSTTCDYGGGNSEEDFAAPVEVVQALVADAVAYLYSEPTHAGVPYDGGWVLPMKSTEDVLYEIDLECHDDLRTDIGDSFINDAWVPGAQGHWASSHPHEIYSQSWHSFSDWVKHESRFFFREAPHQGGYVAHEEIHPSHVLPTLSKLIASAGLVRTRPAATAIFSTTRDLRVLDLTELPDVPSLFDSSKQELREALLFLRNFIDAVCQPVAPGSHVEHVPSQVVSEYFALVHQDGNRRGIDGIVYPSSVVPGGQNVVLFPTQRGLDREFGTLAACRV
jgi:hypothetical protein